MKIYTTDSQLMEEDLLLNDKNEDEATKIINSIYSRLEMGMVPGAALIGDSIVSDNIVAAVFLERYGISMAEIDLHKLSM